MTKQYFSTLLKRVGVSSLIGMAIVMLMIACPSNGGGGDDDGPSGPPPTPPTLNSVTSNNDGSVTIDFKESDDLYFKHTLITAVGTNVDYETHTYQATVPRGMQGSSVNLFGLKDGYTYDIQLQAVSQSGVKSSITEDNKEDVSKTVVADIGDAQKTTKKGNFLFLTGSDDNLLTGDVALTGIQKYLFIAPRTDSETNDKSIKVYMPNIPSLYGIDKIELLAVSAAKSAVDLDNESKRQKASEDSDISVTKEVSKPVSGQEVKLEKLKSPDSGANTDKVYIFYRLKDVNDIVSHWIPASEADGTFVAVKAMKNEKEIANLKVESEKDETITKLTWTPIGGYKTHISVFNVDIGTYVASHIFDAGVSDAASEIADNSSLFSILNGKLYGKGTYKITARGVKDGISTKGISKTITVKDKKGPLGKVSFLPGAESITLGLKKVAGRTLAVSLDQQPFELDYAFTTVLVFIKEASKPQALYKTIVLKKGTLSAQFEGEKNGEYSAGAIFSDIVENKSEMDGQNPYTVASTDKISLATSDVKPKAVEVAIDAAKITAEQNTITDNQVTVAWGLTTATLPKATQVKEWTITPLQYDSKTAADNTATSLSAKTVKGTKFTTEFYKLSLGKWYKFEVKGEDIFGNAIVAQRTAEKLELKTRVPANIAAGATGANVEKPSSSKGILKFTVGNSLNAGKNTDAILVTLEISGKIVKGYDKKSYEEDVEIKPLAGGIYKAILYAYSKTLNKKSVQPKEIANLEVTSGADAPTTGIPAANMVATPKSTSFSVVANTWANLGSGADDAQKTAAFGKHHDESPLEDAKFELYYARVNGTPAEFTTGVADNATAVAIKTKVDSASDAKVAGKIDIPNKTALASIEVSGLTLGGLYRYFIRTVNMIDNTKFLDGVVGTNVQLTNATPITSVPNLILTANTGKKDGFQVTWGGANVTGAKKNDGGELNESEVSYILYYVSVADSSVAMANTDVKKEALSEYSKGISNIGGKKDVTADEEKDVTISTKTFVGTVYIVVEAIHPDIVAKGVLSEVLQYKVKNAGEAPGNATAPKGESTSPGALKVTATAPINFGKKDNGVSVQSSDVKYLITYARVDFDPDGSGSNAPITDTDSVSALKTKLEDASNPAATDTGVEEIENIAEGHTFTDLTKTAGTKYVYFIQTKHMGGPTATPVVLSTGVAGTAVTILTTAELKSAKPGAPAIAADVDTEEQIVFNVTPHADDYGKKVYQGNLVDVEASEVKYWVYYAKFAEKVGQTTISGTSAAADVITVVGSASDASSKAKGIIKIDPDSNNPKAKVSGALSSLTASDKYRYTVVVKHPNDSKADFKATAATAIVKASVATAEKPASASVAANVGTAEEITFTVTPPSDFGKKVVNGAEQSVPASDVKYWVYYAKVGESSITELSDEATVVVFATNEGGGDLPPSDGGIIKINPAVSNPTNKVTGELTGLTGGGKYRYTVVVRHPDGAPNSEPAPAATATVTSSTPAVTTVEIVSTPGNSTYKLGEKIIIKVTFDKDVAVTSSPKIVINVGGVNKDADYDSSESDKADGDPKTLHFYYTVSDGDHDDNGISIDEDALANISGSTIKDSTSTYNAVLTHEQKDGGASQKVDAKKPILQTVELVEPDGGKTAYKESDKIQVKLTFDEDVVVDSTPTIKLLVGAAGDTVEKSASYIKADDNDASVLFFEYIVESSTTDTDGVEVKINSLEAGGGSIKDKHDNTFVFGASDAVEVSANHKIDTTAPTVHMTTMTSTVPSGQLGGYKQGDVIVVKVTFSEDVVFSNGGSNNNIQYHLKIQSLNVVGADDNIGEAIYDPTHSGDDEQNKFFKYTVESKDEDDNGLYSIINPIKLSNGATIEDDAGNSLNLSIPEKNFGSSQKINGDA